MSHGVPAAVLLRLLMLAAVAPPALAAVRRIVNTSCGPVEGSGSPDADGVMAFLGIPYAAAPVGKLRWQPPQPAACWNGTLVANDTGPWCPQTGRAAPPEASEDCLVLHIWAPAAAAPQPDSGLLPVAVYLHGGSLIEGSAVSIQSSYAGEATLARSRNGEPLAVSVGVNYRIGLLGFMALDVLTQNDRRPANVSGNYGLLDVQEALRWLRRNVRAFGGDPDNISVYGQSSGGSLGLALLASPKSKGLFHRVISMSGSARMNSTMAEAATYWHPQAVRNTRCGPLLDNKPRPGASASSNGAQGEDAATAGSPPAVLASPRGGDALLQCLYDLTPAELVEALPSDFHPDGLWGYGLFNRSFQYAPLLVVDGDVLPVDYLTAFRHPPEWLRDMPIVVGMTAEEVDFGPVDLVGNLSAAAFSDQLWTAASQYGHDFADAVLQIYSLPSAATASAAAASSPPSATDPNPNSSSYNATQQKVYADVLTDAGEYCPSQRLAEAMAAGGLTQVYVYSVSQRLSQPFCALAEFQKHPYCAQFAFHAVDMFALFDFHGIAKQYFDPAAADWAWADLVRDRFSEFFSTGSVAGWRRYCGDDQRWVMELAVGAETPRLASEWKAEQCRLFLSHGFYDTKCWVN